MTQFEDLLLEYPSYPWDWSKVSLNSSLSFEFVLNNRNLPFVSKYISQNVNVKEQDVVDNPEYPWDYEGLCSNPNLSFAFFNEYIIRPEEIHRVDWNSLSSNPSITMIDVINNPNYKWNDRYLSSNPNLTSNFILNEGLSRNWYAPSVSSNSGITSRDIYKSTLKSLFEWDYTNLSSNPNLPIAHVHNNIKLNWNYHALSINASLNDIHAFHKIKWDGHGLSLNPNITFEYVMAHPKVKWHYPTLAMNPSITMENMSWITKQSNQPIDYYLYSNPNISIDWIKKNIHTIDWNRLSSNPLNQKI